MITVFVTDQHQVGAVEGRQGSPHPGCQLRVYRILPFEERIHQDL